MSLSCLSQITPREGGLPPASAAVSCGTDGHQARGGCDKQSQSANMGKYVLLRFVCVVLQGFVI